MDAIESAICRVLRSVLEILKPRFGKISTCRSPKSRSRYVTAQNGKRKVVIRISDHKNPAAKCDIDIHFDKFNSQRLIARLDRRKTRNRIRR